MSATGRGSRAAGFTLLEALVAVAIAALVAGIAFPTLDHALGRNALAAAGAGVGAMLREARADAIGRDAAVTLQLAPDGRALLRDGARPLPLPQGMSLTLPARGLTFFPDGGASGGTLVLRGRDRVRRLAVDPATGTVSAGAEENGG